MEENTEICKYYVESISTLECELYREVSRGGGFYYTYSEPLIVTITQCNVHQSLTGIPQK